MKARRLLFFLGISFIVLVAVGMVGLRWFYYYAPGQSINNFIAALQTDDEEGIKVVAVRGPQQIREVAQCFGSFEKFGSKLKLSEPELTLHTPTVINAFYDIGQRRVLIQLLFKNGRWHVYHVGFFDGKTQGIC